MAYFHGISSPADGGFGLMFFTIFLSAILFGVVVIQAYMYYSRYAKDRIWLQLFVAVLLLLDVASTSVNCMWLYEMFVVYWGDPLFYYGTSGFFAANPPLCGVTGFLVQLFLARKLYTLSRSKVLTGAILMLSLSALVGSLSVLATVFMPHTANSVGLAFASPMWLVSTALVDLTLTCALTYYLWKRRSDFKNNNNMVDMLIRMTVQNGLWTTAVAIVDLSCLVAYQSPLHSVSFLMPLLYTIVVISSLNARRVEQEDDGGTKGSIESGFATTLVVTAVHEKGGMNAV